MSSNTQQLLHKNLSFYGLEKSIVWAENNLAKNLRTKQAEELLCFLLYAKRYTMVLNFYQKRLSQNKLLHLPWRPLVWLIGHCPDLENTDLSYCLLELMHAHYNTVGGGAFLNQSHPWQNTPQKAQKKEIQKKLQDLTVWYWGQTLPAPTDGGLEASREEKTTSPQSNCALFSSAQSLVQNQPSKAFSVGYCFYVEGYYLEAAQLVKQSVPSTKWFLAKLWLLAKKPLEAKQVLGQLQKSLRSKSPYLADLFFLKSCALLELGQKQEAQELLNKIIKTQQGNPYYDRAKNLLEAQ